MKFEQCVCNPVLKKFTAYRQIQNFSAKRKFFYGTEKGNVPSGYYHFRENSNIAIRRVLHCKFAVCWFYTKSERKCKPFFKRNSKRDLHL